MHRRSAYRRRAPRLGGGRVLPALRRALLGERGRDVGEHLAERLRDAAGGRRADGGVLRGLRVVLVVRGADRSDLLLPAGLVDLQDLLEVGLDDVELRLEVVVREVDVLGMAEVYEATDIINRRKVAIKMIREDVMKNPINLRRFQNEATIASSLNHPNIVKVFNHGTIEGRPYIANEYVRGQTMKDMLDFRTSIPIAEAVSYMLQLTSALFYAHQHNIIHRDIKPQNIYVMPDGTIKLGDFGIAQAEGMDDSFTKTSEIVGSVHYLAPEISQGKPASIQSDIYAAGVTFYELLTGHVPFDKDTPVNVAVAHVKEKFPLVKKYVPNCPKEIEKIIANATKKRLSDRYKGADEFYDDLLEIRNHPELLKEKKPLISRIFGFK